MARCAVQRILSLFPPNSASKELVLPGPPQAAPQCTSRPLGNWGIPDEHKVLALSNVSSWADSMQCTLALVGYVISRHAAMK